MPDQLIGEVTNYYSRIGVAVLNLEAPLRTGDRVRVLGSSTDLEQAVESMEVDNRKVDAVEPGSDVAIKVDERVRKGDKVYRVAPDDGQ